MLASDLGQSQISVFKEETLVLVEMKECESQVSLTVYDVEEGEISDSNSASSVEEITEEAFKKKELLSAKSESESASAAAAAAQPSTPKAINTNSANNHLHQDNSTNNNHHNTNQKPRFWTMRDLYQYQLSRNYSAGLHNLAWASAVQNKPLDEIFGREFPKATAADNNDSINNSKRVGPEGQDNSSNASNDNVANHKDDGSSAAAGPSEKKNVVIEEIEEKEEGELEEGEIDLDSEMVDADGDVNKENDLKADLDKQADLIKRGFEAVTAEEAKK